MKPFVVLRISIDHLHWVSLFNKLYFQTNSEYSIYIFRQIQSNIWQNIVTDLIVTDKSVNQSIKLWYQRWPCTEQPSRNPSNNIVKALCPLRPRIAKILPFGYQRWLWTKQPSWNSSNNIFQTICPLVQKLDDRHQPNKPNALIVKVWYQQWLCT